MKCRQTLRDRVSPEVSHPRHLEQGQDCVRRHSGPHSCLHHNWWALNSCCVCSQIMLIASAYFFGLVSPSMGGRAYDHFQLISTQKFVLMLTAPYFTFLVNCLNVTTVAIFKIHLDYLLVWGFYCTICCQKKDEHEINHSSWNFYWWRIHW